MSQRSFFKNRGPLTLKKVIEVTGCIAPEGADLQAVISGIAPIDLAGETDLVYMDNPSYVKQLPDTKAGFCIVSSRFSTYVPKSTVVLLSKQPYHAFASVMAHLYPEAMRLEVVFENDGISSGASVHPTAQIGKDVKIDPGVVIGAYAQIGDSCMVGANTVIGEHCILGSGCSLAPNVTVIHAILGKDVILHSGVRIGQDGFGFAMGPRGHQKVPQIGRVLIHDQVEIGANTTIDRGANRDTIIGEGTKIDNLVQIGHNVVIGKHCVIVSCVGIAGSSVLGDFVVLGGGAGVAGHLKVGAGAQVAGMSAVNHDVPAGERWIGLPAKPVRTWIKEQTFIKGLNGRL